MTKTTQTVWAGSNEQDLLVLKSSGRWYTPVSYMDRDQMTELRDAINDALTQQTTDIEPSKTTEAA